MDAVGYDLYCKLLNQAVKMLKGHKDKEEDDFETAVECDIDAYIPANYIKNEYQKLDIYKRISAIENEEEEFDMRDELIDRFGEPPASVKGLLDIALLRNTASRLGITEVKQQGDSLLIYKQKFDVAEVGPLIKALGGRVLLSAGSRPYISVKMAGQPPLEALAETLSAMQDVSSPARA